MKIVEDDTFRMFGAQMMKTHLKLKEDIFFLVDNYFGKKASSIFSKGEWAVWIRLNREIDPAKVMPQLREPGLYHDFWEKEHSGSVATILLGYGDHDLTVLANNQL